MAHEFDPYHKWLAIPPKDQPPNHYRLLGIDVFESDPDVIANAADQRMAHVRQFQTGRHAPYVTQLLNEISAAKVLLLNPVTKEAYDSGLRAHLSVERRKKTPPPPVASSPLAPPIAGPRAVPPGPAAVRPVPQGAPPGATLPLGLPVGTAVAPGAAPAGIPLAPATSSSPYRPRRSSDTTLIVAGLVVLGIAGVAALIYVLTMEPPQPATHEPPKTAAADTTTPPGPDGRQPRPEKDPSKPPSPDQRSQPPGSKPATSPPKTAEPHEAPPNSDLPTEPRDKPPEPAGEPPLTAEEAAARELLDYIQSAIDSERLGKSRLVGAQELEPFDDLPDEPAFLIGLVATIPDNPADGPTINSLFSVFRTRQGKKRGPSFGTRGGKSISVEAKPGYAVGAIIVRQQEAITGLKAVFMKIDGIRLNADDSYEGPWLAAEAAERAPEAANVPPGSETKLGGNGQPIVGTFGFHGQQVTALGIYQVEQ
jgi:hypothetical protein